MRLYFVIGLIDNLEAIHDQKNEATLLLIYSKTLNRQLTQ